MITCAEAVRQLWDYLDGLVDPPVREQVDEHLAFCRRCCGELEFVEELCDLLARPAAEDLPSPVRDRLKATIDQLGEPWAAT